MIYHAEIKTWNINEFTDVKSLGEDENVPREHSSSVVWEFPADPTGHIFSDSERLLQESHGNPMCWNK